MLPSKQACLLSTILEGLPKDSEYDILLVFITEQALTLYSINLMPLKNHIFESMENVAFALLEQMQENDVVI